MDSYSFDSSSYDAQLDDEFSRRRYNAFTHNDIDRNKRIGVTVMRIQQVVNGRKIRNPSAERAGIQRTSSRMLTK